MTFTSLTGFLRSDGLNQVVQQQKGKYEIEHEQHRANDIWHSQVSRLRHYSARNRSG